MNVVQFGLFLLLSAALFLCLLRTSVSEGRDDIARGAMMTPQFLSHRDPRYRSLYTTPRKFFFEDEVLGKSEVAQCYRAHCTEEGSRANGYFDHHPTSRQKACSNYDYQDVLVYQHFFLNSSLDNGGVFVEMGASTGLGASNSFFFERCLNWTGVLFDISPLHYREMLVNRPRATTHKVLGTVCPAGTDISGHVWVANTTAGCCGRVVPNARNNALDNDPNYVSVPCKPVSEWFRQYGVTRVDYFSLDTEGYEYQVLKSIDWSQTRVHVLSVEMLDRELLSSQQEFDDQDNIRSLLASVGLTYVPWLSMTRDSMNRDEFWVNFSWLS
jgi:FkbM family methyltransferase